jgi:predicted CoA-binding protein
MPDAMLAGTPDEIRRALDETSVWFVVGLGNSPDRDAYGVARILQEHGKRVIPIHPRAEIVHGEQGYQTIAEAAAAVGTPDVVDCFVRADRVGAFVDEAIVAGAGIVWLQLGVVDETAAQRARDAGLVTIMDRCPAIEWARR